MIERALRLLPAFLLSAALLSGDASAAPAKARRSASKRPRPRAAAKKAAPVKPLPPLGACSPVAFPTLDAAKLRACGLTLYHQGRLPESASAYEEAVLKSSETAPLLDAAMVRRDLGEMDSSFRHLQRAAGLLPTDAEVRTALGWAALRSDREEAAESAFQAALRLKPGLEEALLGRARVELAQGRRDSAIRTLTELAASSPDFTLAHALLGRALEARGDLQQAASSYHRALRTDPLYSELHLVLGSLYSRQGFPDKAWQHFQKALDVDPSNAVARGEARRLGPLLTRKPQEIIPPRRLERPLSVTPAAPGKGMPVVRIAVGATISGKPSLRQAAAFLSTGPFEVLDPEKGRKLFSGPTDEVWIARRSPGKDPGFELVDEGGTVRLKFKRAIALRPGTPSGSLIFRSLRTDHGTAWESVSDKQLKGTVELRAAGKGAFQLINAIGLEDYLYGVINKEMPSQFPSEALKAQAVVARSQALYSKEILKGHRKEGYDLCDGQHCQVYHGVRGETAIGRAAVDATRGLVLTHRGRRAQTPYSSNCGGHGQASAELSGWGREPYLQGLPDEDGSQAHPKSPWELELWLKSRPKAFCNAPKFMHPSHYRWTRILSAKALAEQVNRTVKAGELTSVRILGRSAAGNAARIELSGTQGKLTLDREHLIRGVMGPGAVRSTMFIVETETYAGTRPAEFYLHGGGWGHGVGMCQVGAAGRAQAGQTHVEIVSHYYPGTALKKITGVRPLH